MTLGFQRAAVLAAITVVVGACGFSIGHADVASAPQQTTWGWSCMYTEHVLWPEGNDVYTDPGDGWTEDEWEVEFRHWNDSTETWTPWKRIDDWGDVDELAYCSGSHSNARIWAFESSWVPLDQFTKTEWKIYIAEDYPGEDCPYNASAPVLTEIDESGVEGVLSSTACTSRAIGGQTDEYVQEVEHYLEFGK